jgi:hypothetical protein
VKLSAKIALITLGLGGLGAIVGSILGAVMVALLAVRTSTSFPVRVVGVGAGFGAAAGAVLAPIAAWTLMRHVPIWRAVAETALGTFVGAGVGLVLQPRNLATWASPQILGLVGFTIAAVRLRLSKRTTAQAVR